MATNGVTDLKKQLRPIGSLQWVLELEYLSSIRLSPLHAWGKQHRVQGRCPSQVEQAARAVPSPRASRHHGQSATEAVDPPTHPETQGGKAQQPLGAKSNG